MSEPEPTNPLALSRTMRTDTPTAHAGESLLAAAVRMLDERLSGLPVVDGQRLVGGLEVVDLMPRLEPVPFSTLEALRLFEHWVDEHNLGALRASFEARSGEEVMREDPPVLGPGDTMAEALEIMARLDFDYVFVVDADSGNLLGSVNRWHALRVVLSEEPGTPE